MEGLKVSYCGGAVLEKEINSLLIKDNARNVQMIERIPGKRLPKTFPIDIIENIKTRTLMVL